MPFTIQFSNPALRAASEQLVLNRDIRLPEYVELTGNLFEFCAVNVAFNEAWSKAYENGWNGGTAAIRIHSRSAASSTVVRMVPGHFELSSCNVYETNRGRGTIILWRIANAARQLGFSCIEATGERTVKDGQMTSFGHLVYPYLGFDAPIPANTPARPASLQMHTQLSELLANQEGVDFWNANGVTTPNMVFDLSPNSLSWQKLEAKFAEVG